MSSIVDAARAYFKTNSMTFSLTSIGATPVTRHYKQFSGVIKDAIDGRVYVGLHFRRADEQAPGSARRQPDWATKHYFAPAD